MHKQMHKRHKNHTTPANTKHIRSWTRAHRNNQQYSYTHPSASDEHARQGRRAPNHFLRRVTIEVITFFGENGFLNDGAPSPKIAGKRKNNEPFLLRRSLLYTYLGSMRFFIPYKGSNFLSKIQFSGGSCLKSSQNRGTAEKKWCRLYLS